MLEDRLDSLAKIERDLVDAATLVELGEAEGDGGTEAEGIAALKALKGRGRRFRQRQLKTLLSGEAGSERHVYRSAFGRGRHRELRLGADAATHVHALGRATKVSSRAD